MWGNCCSIYPFMRPFRNRVGLGFDMDLQRTSFLLLALSIFLAPYLLILKKPKKTRVKVNFFWDMPRTCLFCIHLTTNYTHLIPKFGLPVCTPYMPENFNYFNYFNKKNARIPLPPHENLRIILISIYIYINIYRY